MSNLMRFILLFVFFVASIPLIVIGVSVVALDLITHYLFSDTGRAKD